MAKSLIISLVIANKCPQPGVYIYAMGQSGPDLSLIKMVQWCFYTWNISWTICQFVFLLIAISKFNYGF